MGCPLSEVHAASLILLVYTQNGQTQTSDRVYHPYSLERGYHVLVCLTHD